MATTTEAPMELAVTVKGEIVESNFDAFRELVTGQIEAINTDLTNDEDFGQAEQDIKGLAAFEKTLAEKEDDVLSQMEQVHKLVTGLAELKEQSATKRNQLKRLVDQQKKVVRMQIKRDALAIVSIAHPDAEKRIEAAMKGKRNLDTLRKAAESEANAIETEISAARERLDTYKADHGESIAYDEPKLLCMPVTMLEVEMERRIERKRAEEEKARLKAKAEAARKAEQEAKAASQPQPEKLPDPPKVGSISVGQPAQADAPETKDELEVFFDRARAGFAAVKQAAADLRDPGNISRVNKFRAAVNEAWKEMTA